MSQSGSDTSNAVAVTNSSNTPVVTLDAYDPSSTGNQVYAMPLTLRNIAAGEATINAGATATVPLDPQRITYDLIFARPVDLFPVQDTQVMQNVLSGVYPPVSIDAGSPAQAVLALQFYINLLVNPTSTTATGYYNAVSNATKTGTSSESVEDAVTAFFKSTTNFKTLTLSAVVTAQTYARSFAYVWAGYSDKFASFNNSITYYLYTAGTAPQGSNQASPSEQGTLTLTKNASPPSPADPTDRTGAYTIKYTDPNGNTTDIMFLGGQFVSKDEDFPDVALTGTFILKSTLTHNTSDNTIVPILTGTVHGVQVMGTTVKQNVSGGPSTEDNFWDFFHPKTFGEILGLITTFLGLAMGIEWIGAKGKSLVDTCRGKPSEMQQMRSELNSLREQVRTNQTALLERLGNRQAQVPTEDAMPQNQLDGRAAAVDANNVARADAQLDGFQAQATQVEVAAQYGVNPQLENVAENIRQGAGNLETALNQDVRGADLQTAVDNASTSIQNIQPELNTVIENVGSNISAANTADIRTAQNTQQEAADVEENTKEEANNADEGEGGSGDDEILPVEE